MDSVGTSVNLYSYAENNPIKYTDPLGLSSVRAGVIYDDNGFPIGEVGLEAPNFFLDPINWIPTGTAVKGGKQCIAEGVKRGGWMNSNRYLRIGFGRKGGDNVFRISGQWVEKFVESGHIDLWKGGAL